jgi:hypothetical protein
MFLCLLVPEPMIWPSEESDPYIYTLSMIINDWYHVALFAICHLSFDTLFHFTKVHFPGPTLFESSSEGRFADAVFPEFCYAFSLDFGPVGYLKCAPSVVGADWKLYLHACLVRGTVYMLTSVRELYSPYAWCHT